MLDVYPRNTISDDLKRMVLEDEQMKALSIPFKHAKPDSGPWEELDNQLSSVYDEFKSKYEAYISEHPEAHASDIFCEMDTDFKFDFREMIDSWICSLTPRTEFQRGCVCTLGYVKILLDAIENLNPEKT